MPGKESRCEHPGAFGGPGIGFVIAFGVIGNTKTQVVDVLELHGLYYVINRRAMNWMRLSSRWRRGLFNRRGMYMHMQNLKANTVRTAFCALLVSFALVFAGAAQVVVAPTNAYALDTAKCTAKPNVSGSSDVLGGVETRITWEGQADPDEQIAGVTFTLPEGTTCEPGDTRATMLTGDDLMTRTNLDVSADYKDGKLTVNFSEPAQAGGYFRVEIYKVKFSEMGGDMQLTGAYTLADGTEVAMDTLPAITVKSHSFFESLSDSLAQQDWVKSWNSVLFLKLFLNPSVFVSSLPVVFWGFLMAIGIVACAFPLAIPFGLLLSLMRMSKLRVLRGIATAYVNVVRGTPLFLQIYIAFFGLPLAGIQIPTFPLGVIVLAMNSSAYLCEIFRAGIQSISKGQFEAARSLGMNGAQTMLFVIIPQTVRRVIPTMTSEFILLYKDTSMLAAVGTMEIVMNAKTIVASTGSITPYVVAACFYLIITLPLAKVVGNLESRLASNDTGKGGKKKRKSKKHAIGTGDAAGALGSGAGTAAAEARATGDAVAAKRPDAVEGTGITPEQMSSL